MFHGLFKSHGHMQKKSISLKIFISKGELDLEMLQEGGGECGLVGRAGD